jgi:hypothetical protein
MLENLRIALRKQKKLILIFFLTIFLPALTLSVFGVRAIRNERFRLAKQEENEGRRAARFIRGHIEAKFETIARALDEMARDPAFVGKDYAAILDSASCSDCGEGYLISTESQRLFKASFFYYL